MLRDKTSRNRAVKYSLGICVIALAIAVYLYNTSPRTIGFGTSRETMCENEKVRVDQIGEIPRLAAAYNLNGEVYATEDHHVFKRSQDQHRFVELGHFRKDTDEIAVRAKDHVARLRTTRAIRKHFGANNLVVLESNTFLIFYDKIYRSADGGKSFHTVYDFESAGVERPFLHGIVVDRNDDVYFGEYINVREPHKVRIIKGSQDGTVWSIFHEFPPGEISHIHSIRYDPFRDILWTCSGDEDAESRLMYIDESRRNVELLGGGDQGWRIVSLIATRDFLYWCSDNDRTGSSIYRYDFATNTREELAPVGPPSYYSTMTKDGTLAFTTTYEVNSEFARNTNAPRKTEFRAGFEQNPAYTGPETSVSRPTVDLWISRDGKDWHKVLSVPANARESEDGPSRPTVILPGGDYSSDHLFLTPINSLRSDFSTKVLQITWKR